LIGDSKAGMTGSEDHLGSYAMLIAEVSHARLPSSLITSLSCTPVLTMTDRWRATGGTRRSTRSTCPAEECGTR
jgi:hypothetical protein